MKVYVVFESDYDIVECFGVYTTYQKARARKRKLFYQNMRSLMKYLNEHWSFKKKLEFLIKCDRAFICEFETDKDIRDSI